MKEPVKHYSDGREAWRLGVLGFFTRLRGILATAIVGLIFAGVPWWWPQTFQSKAVIDLKYLIPLTGFLLVLSFIYLRRKTIRALYTTYHMHQLSHLFRDKNIELCSNIIANRTYTKAKEKKELMLFLNAVCSSLREYFHFVTDDSSIEVAIRLAVAVSKTPHIVYRTYARSQGLNPNRRKHSEDIPIDTGIPRFMREDNKAEGVLIYYDLDASAEAGAYSKTRNDDRYPGEIKTMMVAPLNGWGGKTHDMIGLLYITSREKRTFKVKHVDALGFAADSTANAISSFIQTVRSNTMQKYNQ